MKTIKLLAVLALAVTVSSCCSCRKGRTSVASLGETSWQLVSMEGKAVTAEEDKYTIEFSAEGRVSGKGDCNRLTGSYTANALTGSLNASQLASTRMMCRDQASEDRFMKLLTSADSYRIDGSMLMIQHGDETVLVFKKK